MHKTVWSYFLTITTGNAFMLSHVNQLTTTQTTLARVVTLFSTFRGIKLQEYFTFKLTKDIM